MSSPARRHFIKTRAAIEAAQVASSDTMVGLSQYELMLVKLNTDRRRLSDIESMQRKALVKREVLPEYDHYINGVLEGGKGAQDEVLVTNMIWALDANDITRAMPIIRYALRHKLALPDNYDRTLATAIVDEFCASIHRVYQDTEEYLLDELEEIEQLTINDDMPDQARAKLYRLLGEAYEERELIDQAFKSYSQAFELHEGSGVKSRLNRLKKQLDV